MNKNTLLFALIWFALCFSTMTNAVQNKRELEALVNDYEKLAVKAKDCTDSSNLKSVPCRNFIRIFNAGEINKQLKFFSKNVALYFSIEQEITMKGITAVGTIADALGFIFEEQTKTLR